MGTNILNTHAKITTLPKFFIMRNKKIKKLRKTRGTAILSIARQIKAQYPQSMFRQLTIYQVYTSANLTGLVTPPYLDVATQLALNSDVISLSGAYKKIAVTFCKTKILGMVGNVVSTAPSTGLGMVPFGQCYLSQISPTLTTYVSVVDAKDHILTMPNDPKPNWWSFKIRKYDGNTEPFTIANLGVAGTLGSITQYSVPNSATVNSVAILACEYTFNCYFCEPA